MKPKPTSEYASYGYATNVYESKPKPTYEYAAYESKCTYGSANNANSKGRTSSFLGSEAPESPKFDFDTSSIFEAVFEAKAPESSKFDFDTSSLFEAIFEVKAPASSEFEAEAPESPMVKSEAREPSVRGLEAPDISIFDSETPDIAIPDYNVRERLISKDPMALTSSGFDSEAPAIYDSGAHEPAIFVPEAPDIAIFNSEAPESSVQRDTIGQPISPRTRGQISANQKP